MQRALIFVVICSFFIVGVAGACDFTKRGKSQTCTVTVNGVTRQYMLYIPSTLPAAPSLLIYLHGARGGMYEGQNMGWTTKASQMEFIAAYPQGLANDSGATSWNLYFNHSYSNPPDDVGFIKLLIQTVELGLAVDSQYHSAPLV